jgi:hypothetical protein
MAGWMIWAGAAAVVGLFAFSLLGAFWATLRYARLAPPRVRGLAPGESSRVLDLVAASMRARFEELGFRVAGYLATQPMQVDLTDEVVQLIMRNDEMRTAANIRIRYPFVDARPVRVSFDSFLSDGSIFTTVDGSLVSLAAWFGPEHRQESAALDEEGLYQDHLAAIRRMGAAVREIPSFDDIVVANFVEAGRFWQLQIDRGVVRASGDGSFRHPAAKALFGLFPLIFRALARKRLENRRSRLAEQKRPQASPGPRHPEVQAFINERTRRAKASGRDAGERFNKGPGRVLLWTVAIVAFFVTWRHLQHRHRRAPPPQRSASSLERGDTR